MMIAGTTLSYETNGMGFFPAVNKINEPKDIDNVDVVIFWGGEDIGTDLYGEKPNKFVYDSKPSYRDLREIKIAEACIKKGKAMLGICRGAQLLCVIAGGKLLQHIDNHGISHRIVCKDEDNKMVHVTSSHHQMMLPPQDAKILAIGESPTKGLNQFNSAVKVEEVPEVVFFPNIKALGIQAHPEWHNNSKDAMEYFNRKIQEYLK